MAGRFEGLTDEQWEMLKPCFPPLPEKRGKGGPKAEQRKVVNSIFYVLITGSRWCDLPQGKQWGARSTSHRWLGKWEEDGTLKRLKQRMLCIAQLNGQIDWEAFSVDGSFSPRKRRW